MKCTLTMMFWLTAISLAAQPVFEHTFNESASITQLESLGEVYYSMDVVNKQLLLYNMEHTLLKTVPLPTPEGYYLVDIQHVSETMFNDDKLVEFVYNYSKYVPVDLSYYYTYESKLINENGTVLLTLEGVGYTDVIQTTEGKKFLAYAYDYSVIPYRTYTHVYGLPAQTTKSVSRSVSGFEPGDAYPNPAGRQVNIPVTLPGGVSSGTLEITDLNGRKMLTYPLTHSDTHVVMPASQLAPGTYLYQVRAGHSLSTAKKMVIR
ncbi:MAG: T9SS type A sorting domain-containing protein [Bacteroidota bacterium]